MLVKYTNYTKKSFQNNYDICDDNFKDFEGKPRRKEKIGSPIISYCCQCSSIWNYKGDECYTVTLELHIKKFHSEKIPCGLCEYEAEDLEDLEIHNTTCETYRCSECVTIFKSLPEIKDHAGKEHKGKKIWIQHSRRERQNSDFFDTKSYLPRELFSKK